MKLDEKDKFDIILKKLKQNIETSNSATFLTIDMFRAFFVEFYKLNTKNVEIKKENVLENKNEEENSKVLVLDIEPEQLSKLMKI